MSAACADEELSKAVVSNEPIHFVIDAEPENNKATQTVGVKKAVIAAQLETKILRNTILAESEPASNKNTQGKRRTSNRMSFKTIYGDRKKCKYFIVLYPKQFALFAFLSPAKENLTYWNSKPTTGVRSQFRNLH